MRILLIRLKRTRGRRGLDVLKKLQTERASAVLIVEEDFEDIQEVDLKLVRLAKKMNGIVVTNDFNLNKVCDLHQVRVLNINDLGKCSETCCYSRGNNACCSY